MATATNPYSESNLIARLRSKGIRDTDITDDDLLNVIQDALETYLFYRPKMAITTAATCITTVADQPNYAKPTGALSIVDVCWNPDYSSDAEGIGDIFEEIMLTHLDTSDSTILMLQYDEMSKLHRIFGGSWKILNDEVWLVPCPSATGNKVGVVYTTSRTLDELDMIADRRFFDLVYYESLLAVGHKKLVGGGWRAGAYVVNEAVGRETVKHANKKLDEVKLLLAQSYSGRT
jgi:hypothetical protein